MYKRFVVREYKFNFLTSITFSAALHQIKDTPKTLKATSLALCVFMKLSLRLRPQTKFSALACAWISQYLWERKRATHQTLLSAAGSRRGRQITRCLNLKILLFGGGWRAAAARLLNKCICISAFFQRNNSPVMNGISLFFLPNWLELFKT